MCRPRSEGGGSEFDSVSASGFGDISGSAVYNLEDAVGSAPYNPSPGARASVARSPGEIIDAGEAVAAPVFPVAGEVAKPLAKHVKKPARKLVWYVRMAKFPSFFFAAGADDAHHEVFEALH